MLLSETYPEAFDGFHIYDCAVRTNGYCFILSEVQAGRSSKEPLKRMVAYFPDFQGKPLLNWKEYRGFASPHLSIAYQPNEQAVMLALGGVVAVMGSGVSGMEQDVPHGDDSMPLFNGAHGIATIDGYIYAVGGWRTACRRVGPNQWENIVDRKTMPAPNGTETGLSLGGFGAIDGFNANDIYCVGRNGDAWRFDGKQWHQCALPTNMYLENVCCAGDGFVYIGAQSGSVLKGRDNNWTLIHRGDLSLPFRDMVWYQGKVWCTSDYGLWTIENDKLVEPDLPAEVLSCSGRLAVGDG